MLLSPNAPRYLSKTDLSTHPFYAPNNYADELLASYDTLTTAAWDTLEMHRDSPIDAIIGDDLSARAPLLAISGFLRRAHAGGHTNCVPRTYFAASGRTPKDSNIADKESWQQSLAEYFKYLGRQHPLKNVLFITEYEVTGRSRARLRGALGESVTSSTINLNFVPLYIGDRPHLRKMLGVEKEPPKAFSRRDPDFMEHQHSVRGLRSFLSVYSYAIYYTIFGEIPPVLVATPGQSVTRPLYTSEWREKQQ